MGRQQIRSIEDRRIATIMITEGLEIKTITILKKCRNYNDDDNNNRVIINVVLYTIKKSIRLMPMNNVI